MKRVKKDEGRDDLTHHKTQDYLRTGNRQYLYLTDDIYLKPCECRLCKTTKVK